MTHAKAAAALVLMLVGGALVCATAHGQDPKEQVPAAKQPDAGKAATDNDRAFEVMKEVTTGQRELYANHLTWLTILLGFAVAVFTVLQLYATLQEGKRQRERLAQEASTQAQVAKFADATTKNTLSITGMIDQMKGVLSIQKGTHQALQAESRRRKKEKAARTASSARANQVSVDFLNEASVYDDGFAWTLDAKYREINTNKAAGDLDSIDPEVYLVEGLYDSYLRGDDRGAIRVWNDQVLGSKSIGSKPLLATRTNFLIGLSYIKIGDYLNAIQHFTEARNKSPGNGCYRLARVKAMILRHRTQALSTDERTEITTEIEGLHRINATIIKDISKERELLGKMPRPVFQSELVYWHCVYLIHECGDRPEALATAKAMLDAEISNPNLRTSALDGLAVARARKLKELTIALLDDCIRQTDLDAAGIDDPQEEIPINIRKARYYGWRAALKEQADDLPGSKQDELAMKLLTDVLRRKLAALRRSNRDARIFSPITRKHESLMVLDEQLVEASALTKYRTDVS